MPLVMGKQKLNGAAEAGFSLLEVILTLAILGTLTIGVATMLRSGFDLKQGLGEKQRTLHRLSVSMQKLADDIQNTFFVSVKDGNRNGIDRNMKTVFKIEKNGITGDKLQLTTMTHKPIVAGVNESEFTFVTYELKDSKEAPGRKDLWRAETAAIPQDLKEQPPERLLARNIKSFVVEYWKVDRWSQDYWDTGRGDTRNVLPHMVKVTVEAWVHDRADGDGQDPTQADEATDKISTVIYITNAMEYKDIGGDPSKTVNWGHL